MSTPSSASRAPGIARILALDTATERLAVAVQGAGGSGCCVNAAGGAQASATLLPQLAALLQQAGLAYADLDFIAFGRGPGAFTGLRTACAVAQGLALALDRPVLPIDSLLIVAEDARAQLQAVAQPAAEPAPGSAPGIGIDVDIAVAMDARMDEVYAGVYRHAAGGWQVLQAAALYSLPALARAWAGLRVQAVAGSALAAFGARLSLPATAVRFEQEQNRAAALLRLAVQAAGAGAGIDAAQALPLYLRDKVAQTTAERDAVKAAAQARAAADLAAS